MNSRYGSPLPATEEPSATSEVKPSRPSYDRRSRLLAQRDSSASASPAGARVRHSVAQVLSGAPRQPKRQCASQCRKDRDSHEAGMKKADLCHAAAHGEEGASAFMREAPPPAASLPWKMSSAPEKVNAQLARAQMRHMVGAEAHRLGAPRACRPRIAVGMCTPRTGGAGCAPPCSAPFMCTNCPARCSPRYAGRVHGEVQ